GAILFEIVTGRRLWHGKSDVEIFGHLSRGEIPAPDPAATDAPAPLLEICRKALAPRAEDRFATASNMRDELADFLWRRGVRHMRAAQAMRATIVEPLGEERERPRLLNRPFSAQPGRGYRGPLQKRALQGRASTAAPVPGFPTASPIVLTSNEFADYEVK